MSKHLLKAAKDVLDLIPPGEQKDQLVLAIIEASNLESEMYSALKSTYFIVETSGYRNQNEKMIFEKVRKAILKAEEKE
jgi:hypothetical protein